MAKKQTIIWTALPNGKNGENLRLTIYISPQLSSDEASPKLGDFLDWHVSASRNWASKMTEAEFKIGFIPAGGGAPLELKAKKVATTDEKPDPRYWEALFNTTNKVRSFAHKNYPDRLIRSFPATNILSHVKDAYQKVALLSPDNKPSIEDFNNEFSQFCFYEIPKRKRPTVNAKSFKSDMKRTGGNGKAVVDEYTPTYKRRAYDFQVHRKEVTGRISDLIPTSFIQGDEKNGGKSTSQKLNEFRTRIQNDLHFLTQDPSSKLCSQATSALSGLYQKLAKDNAVPPSNPNAHEDFLQLSLYYKPRMAMDENYLASNLLRYKQSGQKFYYDGVHKKYTGLRDVSTFNNFEEANNKLKQGSVSPYKQMPPLSKPELDFHDIVNAVTKFPWLLRKLGLAIDVEVSAGTIADCSESSPGFVYVIPNYVKESESVAKTDSFPRTAFYKRDQFFHPAPRLVENEISRGMYLFGNKKLFNVISLEPGGSGVKFFNSVNNLQRKYNRYSKLFLNKEVHKPQEWNPEDIDNDNDSSLAHLQNCGLSVVKNGNAYSMARNLKNSKLSVQNLKLKASTLNPTYDDNLKLYAEDVTRGMRIDVKEVGESKWYSLMQRVGSYEFLDDAALSGPATDEGYVSPSTSTNADGSSVDLYTTEQLFDWRGWSLVAPRPMKTVSENEFKPDGTVDIRDNENVNPADPNIRLVTNFLPKPKTLPKLRYGKSYVMRARTTDLAGNSWMLKDAPEQNLFLTLAEKYLRHDVVKTPALLLRNPITKLKSPAPPAGGLHEAATSKTEPVSHAEHLEQMVIRSNRDIPTSTYNTGKPWTPDSMRYLAAPRVDYAFAELHGIFDKYFDARKFDDLHSLLIKHDFSWRTAKLDGGYTNFDQDPGTNDPIFTGGTFVLPYLPDPLAKGVVLRGIPGTRAEGANPATLMHIKSDGSISKVTDSSNQFKRGLVVIDYPEASSWVSKYPNIPALELQIIELNSGASPAPEWDAANRRLIVKVEKSDIWRVQYSSYVQPDDVKTFFGIFEWIKAAGASPQRDRSLEYCLKGSHWMLTPYRNLLLAHAVQQPLKDPTFYKPQAGRFEFGGTKAILLDEGFKVHCKSTIKLDVHAEWEDQVDNTTFDFPQHIKSTEFDGAKHTDGDRANKGGMRAFEAQMNFRLHDSYNIKPDVSIHDFKDTKHRKVSYTPVGTTRFKEYFPQNDPAYPFTSKGPSWATHIHSSKRPDAPKVLYLIPVFGWAESENPTGKDHMRVSGLRVYLDRPWYSSGNDEKLGVVIMPQATIPAGFEDSSISKIVTQWGYDPIWLSKPTPSELFPRAVDFVGASKDLEQSAMGNGIIQNVTLDELSNNPSEQQSKKMDIVCYDVHFDKERKLWYSDIIMNHGESYFPFVRLALCRVQPYSMRDGKGNDCFISRVVQADFMQIMPLRKTSVVYDPSNSKLVRVAVEGVSYRASSVGMINSEVEVTLEEKSPSMDGDFAWVEVTTVNFDRIHADIIGGYWAGTVSLPKERTSTKYRIVIREYEQFHGDAVPDESDTRWSTMAYKPSNYTTVKRRIIFADVLELD